MRVRPSVGPASEPEQPVEAVLGPFHVLSPREPAPPFRLVATDGRIVESSGLLGRHPFVVVFFTTWCGACELKLPIVREVAESSGADVFVGRDGFLVNHQIGWAPSHRQRLLAAIEIARGQRAYTGER